MNEYVCDQAKCGKIWHQKSKNMVMSDTSIALRLKFLDFFNQYSDTVFCIGSSLVVSCYITLLSQCSLQLWQGQHGSWRHSRELCRVRRLFPPCCCCIFGSGKGRGTYNWPFLGWVDGRVELGWLPNYRCIDQSTTPPRSFGGPKCLNQTWKSWRTNPKHVSNNTSSISNPLGVAKTLVHSG